MLTTTDREGQSGLDDGRREDTLERSALARGLVLLGAHQEGLRAVLGGRKGRRDGRQDSGIIVVVGRDMGLEGVAKETGYATITKARPEGVQIDLVSVPMLAVATSMTAAVDVAWGRRTTACTGHLVGERRRHGRYR